MAGKVVAQEAQRVLTPPGTESNPRRSFSSVSGASPATLSSISLIR